MAPEHTEWTQRGYALANDAYATGDLSHLKRHLEEHLTPDFVLRTAGTWPEHGEWRGVEGFIQFMTDQMEALADMWIEPDDFIDAGDQLIVPLRLGGRAKFTGIDTEFPAAHVWTLRGGQATVLETYPDKAAALQAVGLSE